MPGQWPKPRGNGWADPVIDPDKLRYAEHLRNEGFSMSKNVEKTGITRPSPYRHLPPRPVQTHTANDIPDTLRTPACSDGL